MGKKSCTRNFFASCGKVSDKAVRMFRKAKIQRIDIWMLIVSAFWQHVMPNTRRFVLKHAPTILAMTFPEKD